MFVYVIAPQENARLLQSLYDEETARFEAAMYKARAEGGLSHFIFFAFCSSLLCFLHLEARETLGLCAIQTYIVMPLDILLSDWCGSIPCHPTVVFFSLMLCASSPH